MHGVTHAHGVIDALLATARSDAQRAAALTAKATAALMAADHPVGIAAAVEASDAGARLRFALARLRRRAAARRRPGPGRPRRPKRWPSSRPTAALVDGDATAEQRGHFWADYAYVLNAARRLRDTAFALQQAIDNAQALGDIAELATLTSNLATVKGNLGQVPDALALALRSLALQAQLGTTDGPEGAVVETYAGLYCGMVGRYDEALQRLDAALACFVRDRQAIWIAVASNHKAQLLIDLGQFARARQALEYERPPIDHVRARGATHRGARRARPRPQRPGAARHRRRRARAGRRPARAHARPARRRRRQRSRRRRAALRRGAADGARRSSSPASR